MSNEQFKCSDVDKVKLKGQCLYNDESSMGTQKSMNNDTSSMV